MLNKKESLRQKEYKQLLTPGLSYEQIDYWVKNTPPGNWPQNFWKWDNFQEYFRTKMHEEGNKIKCDPEEIFNKKGQGRGIVICGGGKKYYLSVYVNCRLIRLLGCKLPISVFHIGAREMDFKMRSILESIEDVTVVDAESFEPSFPIRIHGGWESKVYSILNCPYNEVLMLDADNTPLRDPEYLFDHPNYKATGAVLWPDYDEWKHDSTFWRIIGLRDYGTSQIESGQVLVNKTTCLRNLLMAKYFCDYSDYYFKIFYGDKEAFHLGWRYFDDKFIRPVQPGWFDSGVILQHDLDGAWMFSHRAQAKFEINKSHRYCPSIPYEADTVDLIDELAAVWHPNNIWKNLEPSEQEIYIAKEMMDRIFLYERENLDSRTMIFGPGNKIIKGDARMEREWYIFINDDTYYLSITGDEGVTALLTYNFDLNRWEGKWTSHERCRVTIK